MDQSGVLAITMVIYFPESMRAPHQRQSRVVQLARMEGVTLREAQMRYTDFKKYNSNLNPAHMSATWTVAPVVLD